VFDVYVCDIKIVLGEIGLKDVDWSEKHNVFD
jgi:hypothetical protein